MARKLANPADSASLATARMTSGRAPVRRPACAVPAARAPWPLRTLSCALAAQDQYPALAGLSGLAGIQQAGLAANFGAQPADRSEQQLGGLGALKVQMRLVFPGDTNPAVAGSSLRRPE